MTRESMRELLLKPEQMQNTKKITWPTDTTKSISVVISMMTVSMLILTLSKERSINFVNAIAIYYLTILDANSSLAWKDQVVL